MFSSATCPLRQADLHSLGEVRPTCGVAVEGASGSYVVRRCWKS